ncbi:hypothetical protein P175DRAFT_0529211 [Aspergillus ochraceoroseus IBT 24754]|uniref:Uncharacterized protein n=2 Tax=Aspergillus ochraceoroseus TaxID=138278 RepID=A0A2T5MAT1_9EURO|nr:uncharacterized protein P175DRAFT_0529211 [Aspergillus ochraceoroseus IBT 24754]KKK15572.1 hypothetical protein AOCH_007783 [Aspergillus ochraceoroseus]PTU25646.1 hypothetical protein P175DRAFT_0529211 [Aspergillus ochraceoroseus IBT 24754]
MYPFLPWSHNQASIRSTPSEASPSTHHVSFSFSFGSAYSPTAMPPPPPPSPTDSLLDITPRKCSFSHGYSMNNACAFPSWPNRPSLISADSEGSSASAYLSDEDLFPDGPIPSELAVDEESAAIEPSMGAGDLTTEQQIQLLRAAAEEEAQRAQFLAQVQAHAKAQQALRVAQLATVERENSKRKKRKPVVTEKKRRTTSSSKAVVYRT